MIGEFCPKGFLVSARADRVAAGGTFVALRGARFDGVAFIPEAVARGARRVVVAQDVVLSDEVCILLRDKQVDVVVVAHPRIALAELSAAAYGNPAHDLIIVGITGTKGKTTTSHVLFHLLRATGTRAALLSTVYNQILDERYTTDLTTQQPDYLHAFFAAARAQGVTHVVMEVAAQALSMQRLLGISFRGVAWTNFSPEHGEFYACEQDYFAAKSLLMKQLVPQGFAVLNGGDARIAQIPLPQGIERLMFHRAMVVAVDGGGIQDPCVQIVIDTHQLRCTGLLGVHHGENVCVAVLLARALGISYEHIQYALMRFPGVPGRAHFLPLRGGVVACLDYAHTPDGVNGILEVLRQHAPQVIVVMGCGGDRDRAKRPLMGALAAQWADHAFFTTDNPRSEDPAVICAEMYAGVPIERREVVTIELDRVQAIVRAYEMARAGAVIALLGKGPDEYQIVGNAKLYFSEREILQKWQEESERA